jgi:hypothetical protein
MRCTCKGKSSSKLHGRPILAEPTRIRERLGNGRGKDLGALREMTPERFTENCGQPSSETEPIVLDVKASTVTVTRASAESAGKGVAIDRSKEYRRSQSPYRRTRVPADSCHGQVSSLPISGPRSAFTASLSTKAQYETQGTVWDLRGLAAVRVLLRRAIRMDAYFMIRSTPSTRIGSFYLL